MATTVIDQLIVKLGLDPRDFTKGEKVAADSIRRTEAEVSRSNQKMGDSFASFATKFIGLAALLEGLKKIAGFVNDVSERTRRLGIDSQNFGIAADELRQLQNASELVGGSAKETTAAIGGFQKAVFDLAYNGTMSEGLVKLARLGVRFQNADRSARNFKDVLLDTASALDSSGLNQSQKYIVAKEAGFDEGSALIAAGGRTNAEKALADGKRFSNVTGEDIAAATTIERGKTTVAQGAEAAGIAAETVTVDVGTRAAHAASDALGYVSGAAKHAGDAIERLAERITGVPTTGSETAAGNALRQALGIAPRGLRNNNPLNLKAVGSQARDADGFAKFGTLEEGEQAAARQIELDRSRGTNTLSKLISKLSPSADGNNVPAYVSDVSKQTGLDPNAEFSQGDIAGIVAAMGKHENANRGPSDADVADAIQPMLDKLAPPTPGAASVSGANSTTSISVDKIVIQTQATDAEGIAGDIHEALNRKFNAAHAERGLV